MDMSLIESMLLSKDEEIRKLAFNYIKTNYDINFKVYYDIFELKCSIVRKDNALFTSMESMLDSIVKKYPVTMSFTKDAIKLILEYKKKYE